MRLVSKNVMIARCCQEFLSARVRNTSLIALASVVPLITCSQFVAREQRRPQTAQPEAQGYAPQRMLLETGDWRGLSDLSRDPQGQLWAIPERQRVLLPIDLNSGSALLGSPVSLHSLAPNPLDSSTDTESLAFCSNNRLLLGTESHEERPFDTLLLVRLAAQPLEIERRLRIRYDPWGRKSKINQGIEGLCSMDNYVFAASEQVLTDKGSRHAPFVVHPLTQDPVGAETARYFRVQLTSNTGKLSALTCAEGTSTDFEFFAIERHYGVGRIIHFSLPRHFEGPEKLEATVVVDLVPLIDPLPNIEGLVQDGSGGWWLLTDNHTGRITGPTELIHLRSLSGAQDHAHQEKSRATQP